MLMQTSIVVDLFSGFLHIARNSINATKAVRRRLLTAIRRLVTYEVLSSNLKSRDHKQIFRLTKDEFETFFDRVLHELTRNVDMSKRSGRKTITPRTRLAITLRVLAGSSYGDIMLSFHIGRSTAYQVFHATLKALMKVLTLPELPQTVEELDELSLGFRPSRKRLRLTGYIGAIDGIAIRIKKISCSNAAAFYCRNGYYFLPFQALVDSQYRFLDVSMRCVVSTHDQLAHSVFQLGQYLATKELRIEYWIARDGAYLCIDSLICPIPLSQITSCWEDGFNFYLSSLQIHVEQAFGILVAWWRVLRDLEFSMEVSSEIVALCMKLHIFCVENKPQPMKDITADDLCQRNQDVLAWYDCCKERMASWVYEEELELEGEEDVLTKSDELVDVIRKKSLTRPLPPGAPCRAAEL